MILVLLIATIIMTLLVTLVSCVQVLYLESLRIRSRELPALELFKTSIEPNIGLSTERGALTFSLVKHAGIGLLGCTLFAMTSIGADMWEAFAASIIAGASLLLLSTQLVPQLIYRKSRGASLIVFIPILRIIALTARPLSWTVEFTYSVCGLGQETPAEDSPRAEEPIAALINAGQEEGLIQEEDRELIESAVAFGGKTVREVLTPRNRIVGISADASLEELRDLAKAEQYSRFPAYEDTIDSIAGFVHARDMFEKDEKERARLTVRDILRPIRTVPESKPVNDLLREMQEEGAHMAAVVDEYGSTAGIVTMEDMVEELVGEIHDEHEPERDIREESSGSFILPGNFDLDRLKELLDYSPPEDTESTTVGGLVTEWMGRVPHIGEEHTKDGIVIKVLAANNLRVDQVRVTRA